MDATAVQQLLESIAPLMDPRVFAALTITPMLLQWAKLLPFFQGEWAAILSPAIAVGLVLSHAWGLPWPMLLWNSLLAWIWIEVVYTKVVEPMSRSSNPLFPNR